MPPATAPEGRIGGTVTLAEGRAVTLSVPRTGEHLIRDWTKFRVGRIVYEAASPTRRSWVSVSRDERPALIAAEPDLFFLHRPSDQRCQWIDAWMGNLAEPEVREFRDRRVADGRCPGG